MNSVNAFERIERVRTLNIERVNKDEEEKDHGIEVSGADQNTKARGRGI